MKECKHYSKLYSSYIEHELAAEERAQFERHLNACPTCQENLKALQLIRKRLRTLKPIQTRPDFETVLRARIQMTKNVGRYSFWALPPVVRWPAMATAAAVLLFIMGTWIKTLNFPQTTSTSEKANLTGTNYFYSLEIVPLPQQEPAKSLKTPGTRTEIARSERKVSVSRSDTMQHKREQIELKRRHIRAVSF